MVDARELLNHTLDVVSVLDEDGTVLYETPSVAHLLGYEHETLVGETIFEYIHPEDRDLVAELFQEIKERPEDDHERVEFRMRHADGAWVWVESIGAPRPEPESTHVVVSTRDVTERKRKERRLEKFSGIVSHDLRNPLNVAEGRLALAMEECDSEHLEHVQRALDRMEHLIDDTLALARQGRTAADPEPVALPALIDRCWQMVDTEAATLRQEVDGSVRGDPESLKQLFENLIRNAINHGGDGVTVRVGRIDDTGLFFEDDGPGIPEPVRDRVTEPGYTTTSDGTGFGLAIVEEIVEGHGWSLSIAESDMGDTGARFEMRGVEFVRD
ncbi:PAS domain-containing sensor histidine kinase [Halalkaliarchaeum sp. AArc-CO]|nr:PAS domain-containing sensor histidine kinase [Halalkaliarchaeum sp. AArc-CO]